MTAEKPYKLSIGSANDYEGLIAEVMFPERFGLIISQERNEGLFDVSVHSFVATAADDFDDNRNVESQKVALSNLLEAIDVAVGELRRLKRSPPDNS